MTERSKRVRQQPNPPKTEKAQKNYDKFTNPKKKK